MTIPKHINIIGGELPAKPGVYIFRGANRRLLYVGKATSLRTRVSSHFSRPFDGRIAKMTSEAKTIEFIETSTAVEALMLESRMIRRYQPYYNILSKDDKSYVHLAFTREPFPRPTLIRQHELDRVTKSQFMKVLGPFSSSGSVQSALDAVRKAFPWSDCRPPASDKKTKPRPCFYRHLGKCPGVCTGEISPTEYRKIIRQLIRFLEGGRLKVIVEMESEMHAAADAKRFEEAAAIRDRIKNLKQIRDLTVIGRDRPIPMGAIDLFGRIEGYDISNISGTDTVGSMSVFIDGRPKKSEYRKFAVRGVTGPDDTKAMAEVMRRRLGHLPGGESVGNDVWPLPDLILVDGGAGQVNAVRRELESRGLVIPLVGIAKGPDRKQDVLVYRKGDHELARLVSAFKPLLQQLRDEAHRFAVSFHRQRRRRRLKPKS